MLRQQAFTGREKLLKGGLHCHTTRSDGVGTPEDVIRMHEEHGYDFLAITDHRIYNYKNFLPGSKLTILPGMEMDRGLTDAPGHCLHTVSVGPTREDGNGFEQDQVFPSGRVATQAEYQPVLDMLHENNNLTIYCHPGWSCTPTRSFDQLQGDAAMELWNTGCVQENNMDLNNERDWDELLLMGKKTWGVATDDGHRMASHCLGWVMVNSENHPTAIIQALRDGAFYASCGPVIRDFYVEDGVAHVACSEAGAISFNWGGLPYHRIAAQEQPLTEAAFTLPDRYTYVRVTVTDDQGRMAWSNPIFLNK